MPTARKRSAQELDANSAQQPEQPSILQRLRNMWQFANLYQFILLFGSALKLDDNMDIEDFEAECLKPGSMKLQDIGLGLLKFLSSHRGLTHELFDEYTRRQFLAKAPEKNPFGTEETPLRFADFDVFKKIRVLQQMTQLVMMHPERLREKTQEQKDTEQTNWRIEPYGWDRHDRTYYVLDDNRLYRLTEAPPPPPKPKKNTKKARAALRTSKRRRTESGAVSEADDAGDEASEAGAPAAPEDDGLGGMKWECLAVNLAEVRQFLSTIEKTKDPNEKILRDQIQQHLVPILEKQEESKKRKQLQKEKELLALEKLANAKRSSRIASKLEQKRLEEQAREEERKRREEEEARRKAELQRLKMERERDKRIMAREMRLREREARRRLHEEELAQLSEDGKAASSASGRMSERRRLAEIERAKKALEQLEQEEEDWIFDCICGVYGRVDDGTHSVACERCNTWQHSKCLGIKEEEAEREDFHFICSTCRRREEQKRNQLRPRIIKLKVHRDHDPAEPVAKEADKDATELQGSHTKVVGELQSKHPDDFHESSVSRTEQYMPRPSTQEQGTAVPDTQRSAPDSSSMQPSAAKQTGNPFASLYPSLLPPDRQLIRSSAVPLTNNESASRLVSNNQYLGLVGDEAKSTGSALSLGVEGGSGISPSKQPSPLFPSPTKPALPGLASSTGTVPTGSATIGGTISIKTPLPQLAPVPQPRDASPESGSSPLPPSSAGLSPVKQSPPQHQANGTSANSAIGTHHPTASVFPPVAALSPSPRQQILTPPVKPAEPVRLPPPQLSQNMPTPRLVPSPPSQQ